MKTYIVYYTLRQARGNDSTIYTMTLQAKNTTQARLKARDEFICTPYKVIKVRRDYMLKKFDWLFWLLLAGFDIFTYTFLFLSIFIDWGCFF